MCVCVCVVAGSCSVPKWWLISGVELQIEIVEPFCFRAVHFVDSLADSGLLIKYSAIQTEELNIGHFT